MYAERNSAKLNPFSPLMNSSADIMIYGVEESSKEASNKDVLPILLGPIKQMG